MRRRYSDAMLRRIRNEIPIAKLISGKLDVLCKTSEGVFRFLCPSCSGFHTATNPKTNLARCFRCKKNFNTIDIVMIVQPCSFLDAVELLRDQIDDS